jgi:hypothetical protein
MKVETLKLFVTVKLLTVSQLLNSLTTKTSQFLHASHMQCRYDG